MDIRKYMFSGKTTSTDAHSGSNDKNVPSDKNNKANVQFSNRKVETSRNDATKRSKLNRRDISLESKPSFVSADKTPVTDIDSREAKNSQNGFHNSKLAQYSDKIIKKEENKDKIKNSRSEQSVGKDPKMHVKDVAKRIHESDSSDEEPIQSSKVRSSKVVYSDSDEDPLPQCLRSKKKIRLSSPEEKSSCRIKDAFTRVMPKTSHSSNAPEKMEQQMKPITVPDFFGCSPIQRMESRHFSEKISSIHLKNFQQEIASSLNPSQNLSKTMKRDNVEDLHDEDKNKPHDGGSTSNKVSSGLMMIKEMDVGKTKENTMSPTGYNRPLMEEDVKSTKKNEDRRKSYLAFKNREPPKALGSKKIPEGKDNCLEGLTFVLTGVCESIDRDECKSLIERYAGKVTTNVSRNTKFLVTGRDAGASKLAKADELKTKQINEDELFDLIRTLPGKKSKHEMQVEKERSKTKIPQCPKTIGSSFHCSSAVNKLKTEEQPLGVLSAPTQSRLSLSTSSSQAVEIREGGVGMESTPTDMKSLLWVDKYKPASMKNIIGQQGDKSQAKKLYNWLISWHQNVKKPLFGKPSDDGNGLKAALLSGPPGVGKTTTTHIVCQEAGFSFFELNASDTRSKKSLKEFVSEALRCHSLSGFFTNEVTRVLDSKKHCLVMDEVDGIAGNEDRGGIQELIQLIKSSYIPIICMCNDRNHPKIRSLANYCFDLRFQRPKLEQIKASMMKLAFKEELKIPPPALNEIIIAANHDIRQVIHNLSMWSVKDKNLTYEQLKQDACRAHKDLHFSPFDVCRKVFSGEESRKITLNDKSDLFFHDYSIAPLFVQENYLSVTPFAACGQMSVHLKLLGASASSMSMGDLVDGHVRRSQHWGLLPTQAMFASVIPGEFMRGSMSHMIQFPSWLGKNSTTNKNTRLLQELTLHTSLSASCSKQSLNLDYLPAMKRLMAVPLVKEGSDGIKKIIDIMTGYNLLREDFNNIMELTSWSGGEDPMSQIDSKVKAAFTRAYNKCSNVMPYTSISIKKSRKGGGDDFGDGEYGNEEVLDDITVTDDMEEDATNIAEDAMIMLKKPSKSYASGKAQTKEPPKKKRKQGEKQCLK